VVEEESVEEDTSAPSTPVPDSDETIPPIDDSTVFNGDMIRKLRERKGMTLREISDVTRIGVPSLTAVEEERFDDLPNARIYVRGFVRCMAIELALDPEQVSKSYLARWERWFEEQKLKQKPGFM